MKYILFGLFFSLNLYCIGQAQTTYALSLKTTTYDDFTLRYISTEIEVDSLLIKIDKSEKKIFVGDHDFYINHPLTIRQNIYGYYVLSGGHSDDFCLDVYEIDIENRIVTCKGSKVTYEYKVTTPITLKVDY